MQIKASKVIGLKVITMDSGEKIEDVDDVLYSPNQHKVEALLVKSKGIFSDAKVIPIQDIQSIGEDAVMVPSKDVMKDSDQVTEEISSIATSNDYLTQSQVVTEEGKELGKISDIEFDSDSGRVTAFEVSQGALKNIQSGVKHIRVDDIITVGKDAIVVKATTVQAFERQAEYQGVQGAVNKTQQMAPEYTRQAQQKFEDIKDDPRTQDFVQNVKGAIDMLIHDARVAADKIAGKAESQRFVDDIKRTTNHAVDSIRQKADEVKSDPDTQQAIRNFKKTAHDASQKVEDKIREVKSQSSGEEMRPIGTLGGKTRRGSSD